MANSYAEKALLLRFNITQTLQIHLTKLKAWTSATKGDKTYKCHHCTYSAKFKSALKIHVRSHTGEKSFSCTLCKYNSSSRSNVIRHTVTHTGEKHYKCAFCAKPFAANAHKAVHENVCKVNPKQSNPSWVELQKTFKCQLCSYSAAQKYSLNRHMVTHTGDKPFPCTLCNKTFISEANLQRHIFTHTREKPYNCQFCTSGFADVAHQKKHEKICKVNPQQGDAKWVEEQKKFKCHLCKYRTITKGSLKKHLRSHTGEKPYKCPLCFYKSSFYSNLRRHLRQNHVREKGYKCRECGFSTLSLQLLLNHCKKAHVKKCIC